MVIINIRLLFKINMFSIIFRNISLSENYIHKKLQKEDKPLPYDLISKIVKFRVIENIKMAEEKLKKKK
jgi:hypothetical protein